MALGTITSLGVGSNFELQEMLDNLRKVDETSIESRKTSKTKAEAQLSEFDSINAKVLNMKSSALTLSLASNFLERSVSSSDEEIATATGQSGIEATSYSLEVTALATKSSWQSVGVDSEDAVIYPPPDTGITSSAGSALSGRETLSFTIGHGDDQKAISLELSSGSSLDSIAKAINEASANQGEDGETHVKASVATGTNGMYIRLESTDTNTANNNQILVTEGPDFIAPDISFAYKIGAENDQTFIAVKAGTTYKEMATAITEDPSNTGISASVIDDGSGSNSFHLTLTSKETGEDNRIFLEGLSMEEVQGKDTSLNASLTVNGVQYQRQTNDNIEDVVQGLTINLKKEGETSLGVSSNMETMKTEIKTLVETFNEIIQDIKTSTKYSSNSEENGVLSGVTSMGTLSNQLMDMMETSVTIDGSSISLIDLGMEVNRDGTITLDETVLNEVASKEPEKIRDLFIGSSEKEVEGLGDLLNESLRNLTSISGPLEAEKSSAEEKISRLNQSIEDATERLDKKYETMAESFVRLDTYISQMNSQSEYLTSVFDSFNSSKSDK